MKDEKHTDPAERWVATFTWEDRLIARFFPRFFKKYAPEEVQQQWAAILARKQQRRSGQDGDANT